MSIKDNADMDKGLYRYRHLVENAFARLKRYRAVAFRYDKRKRNVDGGHSAETDSGQSPDTQQPACEASPHATPRPAKPDTPQ
jgi:hypothetical protein